MVGDESSEPLDARDAIAGKSNSNPKPTAGDSKSSKAAFKYQSKLLNQLQQQRGKHFFISSVLLPSGVYQHSFDLKRSSTTNAQYCTPTISKKNLLKTTICMCPDGIKASASKTPNPQCPYTSTPPLSAMLPMQNADGNSEGGSGSFWSKAWEVAKPHAGQVAGKAGQFALDRYGQPIKDKFNHLIPVKGQDVSAADLAQVDPVQMEQAEQSQAAQAAAEVDPSTYENEQSEVGDGQAGAVQGGGSASSGSGGGGNGNGVDGTAAQWNSQDAGQVGQQNGSPSSNEGQNGQMGSGGQQNGGASQQSGSTVDNDANDSLNGASGQGNPGNAAGNQAGNTGNQGKQNAAAPSGGAQGSASQQNTAQNTGFESGSVPNAATPNQPGSHVRSKRVASSNLASSDLNWNGTSGNSGSILPSGSAPSVPLGTGTTSGAGGDDGLACPVHGDVSPDEMQGDDDPDSALPVGAPVECKQKRDILRLRTVKNCSPTVISSGSTFTSTIVCDEDIVTARDEICDSGSSTAASGASFATGGAAGSAGGSAFFPNGTATSDPIVKTANAGVATSLGARNPKPRDGRPFVVDKSYAGSGSNSSVRSQMAGTAYSGIGKGSALPMISIDGPACSARLSSNITVSYSSNSAGTSSSTDSVTGVISSSVASVSSGPLWVRDEPASESKSLIRLLVSHGASPASSPHVSITRTELRSLHLGSAVLGQRWAHEFADVPATTQAAGAEVTESAGSGKHTTDPENADGQNEGIEEEALEGEDFDLEYLPDDLLNFQMRIMATQLILSKLLAPATSICIRSNATTPSSSNANRTVLATIDSSTNRQTSELYNPPLTRNAPLTSPTATLPSSTPSIPVSRVTVTADPWVWTTTLGQNGDDETNGTVIACEATAGMNIPITDAPRCVTTDDARWAILSTPPPTPYVYVKAPVDSSAYVGNLTATALSSALYSALSAACPGEESAMLANASSTEMCFNGTVTAGSKDNVLPAVAPGVVIPYVPLAEEEILLCNMAGLMLIEYYSGNRTDGPDTRLFLSFSFQDHEGGSDMTAEICEKVMLGMDIAGTVLACIPIIGPIISAVMKASKAACRMAEKVEETADKIDAAIAAGTEVVDNLLSLKSDLPLSVPAD
ncbi:hypothetical protein KC340_g16302 [Hortaea werneckii]|nr:hypothetical protein KC342_g16623 [Hortaea werneckii]KAI7060123.1 hypothetical protein KC339_g17202 [Hortaea werneckii]KAI7211781.1 hypothetical protein KC365_g14847 [Hortaea werneckii]KAI7294032.1 hypothetical protein KC340_g16302 [Hortaea werneckii]KAI7376657.1 hypothetical protein KC328_g14798 [Hortaea werneckii]